MVEFAMALEVNLLKQDSFKACQTAIYPFVDSEEIPLNLEFFVFPNGVKMKVSVAVIIDDDDDYGNDDDDDDDDDDRDDDDDDDDDDRDD